MELTALHGKFAMALALTGSVAAWGLLVKPHEAGPVCRMVTLADGGVQPGFDSYDQRPLPACTRVELPALADQELAANPRTAPASSTRE